MPVFRLQTESLILEKEVQKLLLKGAVEKINPEDTGSISKYFWFPKRMGN